MALTKVKGHIIADDLALGGNPTTSTQSTGNNTTRIATTAFVQTELSALVDSSPSALNTLNELAAALGDDANFSTTVTNSIATKLPLAGGTLTGALTVSATTATVNITGGNSGASLINFGDAADGNVGRIYYDHTDDFMQFKAADGERFRINSTGIDVTGTATMDGLTVDGDATSAGTIGVVADGGTLSTGKDSSSTRTQIAMYNPTGQVAKFDTNSDDLLLNVADNFRIYTAASERLRIDSSGNVGIGTNSPSRELELKATTPRFRITDTDGGYSEISGSGGHLSFSADVGNTQGGTRITFDTDASEAMRIDSSGNVGIGTTSPTRTFEVNSGTTNVAARFESTDSRAVVEFKDPSGTAELGGIGSDIYFAPAGVEKVRIDNSGNVGIGTSSPDHLLEIETTSSSVAPKLGFRNTQAGAQIGMPANTNALSFTTADTERMRIDSSGNVGIGETSPSAPLDIAATSAGIELQTTDNTSYGYLNFGDPQDNNIGQILYDHASNYMRFQVNNTEKMRITSSGTMGFGMQPLGTNSGSAFFDGNVSSKDGFMTTGTNLQLLAPSAGNTIFVRDNGYESARIDSSGKLLVGYTSSGGSGKVQADVGFDAQDGSNTTSIAIRNYSSAANSGSILVDPDNVGASSVMYFGIDGVAPSKMKLDSAGRLNIDQVDTRFGSGALNITGEVGNSYDAIQFRHNASTIVGRIRTTSSSTAYNTSSDYRLKENVDYDFNALDRVAQLKPARFNFIADADNTVDGFLAHEVQDIVPEAITGEKDAMMDEEYEITPAVLGADGSIVTEAEMGTREVPEYQGIDQSKLVPLLTKAIQELEARITILEG